MVGRDPQDRGLDHVSIGISTAFRNRLLIPHPQLLAHATFVCGQDVDVLGVHTQKCRLDGHLTHSQQAGCVPGRDDPQLWGVSPSGSHWNF